MTLDPNAASEATAAEGTAEHRRQIRKAGLASTVGTTIEWYDFFLYNTAAALVFPALFFPESSQYAGRLESFATYAVGFAARPVGAAIFGHWGDRIGRKATLIITLLMMGLATTVVGVLPSADHIGRAAPLILVLLRLFQGIAVGGEWSGSVLLSMEWGDQKRRGLMASLPQLGVAFGLILGTGFLYLMSAVTTDAQFQAWGWRIPFLCSAVLVGIGLYIRLSILETPMFAKRVAQGELSRLPSLEVWRAHWKPILLSAFARLSEQAPFYVITTFTLTYLTEEQGYSKRFALSAILLAAAVEVVAVPLFGHLSDTYGRKRIYMVGAAVTGVYGFVLFALLDSGVAALAFVGMLVALIPHGMQYGPQASLIAEQFPTALRYAGAGVGYQLASVIAGGPAPLVATYLLEHTGSGFAIAGAILGCSVVTLIAVGLMREHSGSDIADDATYARAT
ncbi:MFS transporter [Nocardioides mangrovicus]|uniref:MFS transporter n=1 Tax=Nocardioides mangrovicus TaxID=2478913 RepID=A0A3L8P6Q5_9ACTN|nr:MFS transporter [Nocardioides mangrovicus]RLV51100.1 MFS transporter [Nocardioides mangrovicus]